MSHGGFIDHHFAFVGDGRGSGTGTLGNSQELAKKIICNAALQLTYAGWIPSNTAFDGTTITNAAWILNSSGSYTKIFMKNDTTTYAVLEVPMTYTANGETTKIWLLYNYGRLVSGTMSYDSLNTSGGALGNYLGSLSYEWSSKGTSNVNVGLSLLYCPPGCEKENSLKCGNLYVSGTATNAKPLSINNTTATYTYNIITRGNAVGIFTHASSSSVANVGFMYGPMINEFYDSSDTTCTYKQYAAFTNQCALTVSATESTANTGSQNTLLNYNISIIPTANIPYLQFYNASGIPQPCNSATSAATASQKLDKGLWEASVAALRALNAQAKGTQGKAYYSRIRIGNLFGNNTSNWQYASKVSAYNGLKGVLDPDYVIMVDAGGSTSGFPVLFNIGDTFDNGNYVHIGSGVCIGWDGSNKGLLDTSDNPMLDITETEPT